MDQNKLFLFELDAAASAVVHPGISSSKLFLKPPENRSKVKGQRSKVSDLPYDSSRPPQHRAGAGPNKSSSSQFLELR